MLCMYANIFQSNRIFFANTFLGLYCCQIISFGSWIRYKTLWILSMHKMNGEQNGSVHHAIYQQQQEKKNRASESEFYVARCLVKISVDWQHTHTRTRCYIKRRKKNRWQTLLWASLLVRRKDFMVQKMWWLWFCLFVIFFFMSRIDTISVGMPFG